MTRIFDKNATRKPWELIMGFKEYDFLEALVVEISNIIGMPDNQAVKSMLKHSLKDFLINEGPLSAGSACGSFRDGKAVPTPVYPRGLLNEYADYIIARREDMDTALKGLGRKDTAGSDAGKGEEKGEINETPGVKSAASGSLPKIGGN